ncbi:MAG: hypothetical protein ONA90_06370 [candidate division KSB1 bacterium]|nr:hypothetical protein [candidate division KSB1 bacterium]
MKYIGIVCAAALLGLVVFSCGSRDDRSEIRGRYGDPNTIQRTGVDPFWSETWFYNSLGLAFEFRRNAACGSFEDVYLFATYDFIPPPSDTTGAKLPALDKNTVAPAPSPVSLWPIAPK